jgi:hypothetical protein
LQTFFLTAKLSLYRGDSLELRRQALGKRGDEIFLSVELGNHRLPMMKVTLGGCPIAKTGELKKDGSF